MQSNAAGYSVTVKSRHENLNNYKRMFELLTRLMRKMNVRKRIQCPEPLLIGSRELNATNGPTTVESDSAASIFVATAHLTTLTISRLQIYVTWQL
jgi:hypothetical protein